MNILGVIPARGGSKRLQRKNILPLAGRPLIDWTIQAARDSGALTDFVVSTDDQEIADVARQCGARVIALRPADLATDTATAVSVMQHETRQWEDTRGQRLDGVLLLQPTSPFRSAQTIRDAVQTFRGGEGRCTVVGVSPAGTHPFWCLQLDGAGDLTDMHPGGLQMRSQELPAVFEVNGTAYLVPRNHLMASGTLYTARRLPVVVQDPAQTIDIDTPFDWRLAQALARDFSQHQE